MKVRERLERLARFGATRRVKQTPAGLSRFGSRAAVKERLEGLSKFGATRPVLTLGVVLALALIGGVLALSLQPNAGSDTFVSRSASSFQATDADHRHFGADPVVILIREPLTDLVETKDLATVSQLEACLAGQVLMANQTLGAFTAAQSGTPYGGWGSPCGKLMKTRPVQVVYGPGTFLNRAVAAVNAQIQAMLSGARQQVASAQQAAYQLALARGMSRKQALAEANAAGTLMQQQQTNQLAQTYLNSGITGTPRIDDPQFIPQIVFDQSRGVNQPKARFSYLFPTADAALIQVRLKASLSDAQQARAISLIRQAVKMPMFASAYGGTYTVTGAPVVAHDLAEEITGSIAGLLIAAVLVMALALWIVFRRRPRLLPLAIALAATGITFGATSLVGASLTMASIAVLPILIGLAVDYAIQFQSRAQEAREEWAQEAPEPPEGRADTGEGAAGAVARAAAVSAPTIATAALATATGFLVLLLSPVPMVRGFGVLLVVGIGVALLCALTAGSAALVMADHERRERLLGDRPRLLRAIRLIGRRAGRTAAVFGASLRGAREILQDLVGRVPRLASPDLRTPLRFPRITRHHVLARAVSHPERILAVGALLAALGWMADTQTSVQSDVTKLVPTSMPALRDLRTLERITGVSGEIDVTVHARDVATPKTIGWMIGYEQRLLSHYGYLETKGCAAATLCPALSLPDLFSSSQNGRTQPTPSASAINSLLGAVPNYFKQAVITADRQDATLAFGIRLMPLSRQQRVIDYMRSQLHPPGGVSARLAGLPVLAAEANTALSSSGRRLLTLLAGLVAVGLVLLAVFRDRKRALLPLVPIALATGWSALILFLIRIPLNPMSATLGALVIAISTEFSVLLSERFRQERLAGHPPEVALARTYQFTGAAVLASGVTAIAGFGVLVLSSITMLRDFGFVTLVDLSVSLAGVMLVLPSVLALAEREDLPERRRELGRRVAAAMPRRWRRARVA
jgi:hydrophobe/amphiphile efflux-3 (HAE3) family protein